MLAVLMYHRVYNTPFPSSFSNFEKHLQTLAKNYTAVVPGDKIDRHKISLCFTFDDAYFDFYHHVFPLLQKWQIKALLAIPVGLIIDDTSMDSTSRLHIPYKEALALKKPTASLCTWREIREMLASGLVLPAVHGFTHSHITDKGIDIAQEVLSPLQIMQEKTGFTPSTFIYPYGNMTRSVNGWIHQYYRYTMRIGTALNWGWQNVNQTIYRINAEEFWPKEKAFLQKKHMPYFVLRWLYNTLRGK